MITYSLACENQHKFDAWFRSAEAYDEQQGRGIVTCPVCGSGKVQKALMAPALSRANVDRVPLSQGHPMQAEIREFLRAMRKKVVSEADYVGDKFAEEARRIHFKEADARGIYGEATRDEVAELLDEGIDFLPLPQLPEEAN
ncbi:MAG: DUF1178 family protein [Devosia sp.]